MMGNHCHHKKRDCVINENITGCAPQETSPKFTLEQAQYIANCLGVDFARAGFDLEQFRMGLDVELEHGLANPYTNVTNNDPLLTGKIALAHLNEFPDYYTRLAKMEAEARRYWDRKRA